MISDPDVTILLGDAREQLATLPAESVQCIVTSPPFWGLRDYGTGRWEGGDADCDHTYRAGGTGKSTLPGYGNALTQEKVTEQAEKYRSTYPGPCPRCGAVRVDDQIGLEATPEEWCANLVAVFREARRVLRPDGVAWIEVGDTYTSGGRTTDRRQGKQQTNVGSLSAQPAPMPSNLKAKDLVGAPWLLAFALRADGWYLRSDTIWERPNPMPESVTDRPTKAHSYVFLLAKSDRYFYDAIREVASENTHARGKGSHPKEALEAATEGRHKGFAASVAAILPFRNARSVWKISTEATSFAHFATMPTELARRCIAAGTSEHGCCSECGAPWRRLVEHETLERYELDPSDPRYRPGRYDEGKRAGIYHGGNNAQRVASRTSMGWEAGCEHDAERVPCVVLDPFMGSGTTALVARRMGRRAVGVELSPAYLEIARTRLAQQSLFA